MLDKYFLQAELEDDSTPYGGVSFKGETVQDFINDSNETYNTEAEVNHDLVACGIRPVLSCFTLLKKNEIALADLVQSKNYAENRQDFIAAVNAFQRNLDAQDVLEDMKEYPEDFKQVLSAISKHPLFGIKVLQDADVIAAHNSGDNWMMNTLEAVEEWLQWNQRSILFHKL